MSESTAVVVMSDTELTTVLQNSLYPGAKAESIKMVLGYCKAAGLDPLQKVVHIVPLWNSKLGAMQDVIMPGIGLYRVQAARTGEYAGVSEPEFGPDVEAVLGGHAITYPEWARVTVKRALKNGVIAEFTAREYWIENYASKGGKEKSIAPNAMWAKRTRGQIAKCASAQALRMAFPERIGSQPTAEEMEGKIIDVSGNIISNDQESSELLSKWLQIAESITDEAGLKAAYAEGIKEFKAANDLEGAGSFRKYVTEAGEAIKSLARKRAEAAVVDVVAEEKPKTTVELNEEMAQDIPF